MRRFRAVLVAAALAAAAWGAVAMLSGDDGPDPVVERPERLVDARPATLEWVEVIDPAGGRIGRLDAHEGELVVVRGEALDEKRLAQLRDDLAPLLAIRLVPSDDPAFGLAEPRLEVAVSAGGTVTVLSVGDANFDDTGVYVRTGGRIALVLPRVVETLAAVVGA